MGDDASRFPWRRPDGLSAEAERAGTPDHLITDRYHHHRETAFGRSFCLADYFSKRTRAIAVRTELFNGAARHGPAATASTIAMATSGRCQLRRRTCKVTSGRPIAVSRCSRMCKSLRGARSLWLANDSAAIGCLLQCRSWRRQDDGRRTATLSRLRPCSR